MKKDKQQKKCIIKKNVSKNSLKKPFHNATQKVSKHDSFSLDFSDMKNFKSKINFDTKLILSNKGESSNLIEENSGALLMEKIKHCCVMHDFKPSLKSSKKQTLNEIIDFITQNHITFTDALYKEVINMVATNLFRDLPPRSLLDEDSDNDEDPYFVTSLSHTKQVYQFFLKIIESPDFNSIVAKKYIDKTFITSLLNLFDSEDFEERNLVHDVVHRIYGNFVIYRPYIRNEIANIIYRYLYETDEHCGISNILELYRGIIHGFIVPLNYEYVIMLKKILIPLFKMPHLREYNENLTLCVAEFLQKDPSLSEMVILGFLKYWPKTNSSKEILILKSIEYIIERINGIEFKKVIKPLFAQFARCISSINHKVKHEALLVLQNEIIRDLMGDNISQVMLILLPALYSSRNHWNTMLPNLVFDCLTFLMESDQQQYDVFSMALDGEQQRINEIKNKREKDWDIVLKTSKLNPLYIDFEGDLCNKIKSATLNDYKNITDSEGYN